MVSSLLIPSVPLPKQLRGIRWHERVQPWHHYVPVKPDQSDVYDIMTFLRANDAVAREIAIAHKARASRKKEEATAYLFRYVHSPICMRKADEFYAVDCSWNTGVCRTQGGMMPLLG